VKGNIKIAVAGAHSTGKTTFLSMLSTALIHEGRTVRRIGDLATEAQKAGLPILREHTFASTTWIIAQGIAHEYALAATSGVILLVDRPVADALGYLFAALEFRDDILPPDQMEFLDRVVAFHMRTYDYVIETVIDADLPITDDGARDMDWDYRIAVAKKITVALDKHRPDRWYMARQQRAETLEKVLREICSREVKGE
jgi:nicotinamide riboside kinase